MTAFLTCAYAVATSPLCLFFLAAAVIVAVVEFAIFVRRECRRAERQREVRHG